MLKLLNTSVHHEMLAPLKANVDIAERLVNNLRKFPVQKKMVQTILISSQMVMLHANDMLDQRIIENGSFVPLNTIASVKSAILEMIELINLTLYARKLKITFDKNRLDRLPKKLKFD